MITAEQYVELKDQKYLDKDIAKKFNMTQPKMSMWKNNPKTAAQISEIKRQKLKQSREGLKPVKEAVQITKPEEKVLREKELPKKQEDDVYEVEFVAEEEKPAKHPWRNYKQPADKKEDEYKELQHQLAEKFESQSREDAIDSLRYSLEKIGLDVKPVNPNEPDWEAKCKTLEEKVAELEEKLKHRENWVTASRYSQLEEEHKALLEKTGTIREKLQLVSNENDRLHQDIKTKDYAYENRLNVLHGQVDRLTIANQELQKMNGYMSGLLKMKL